MCVCVCVCVRVCAYVKGTRLHCVLLGCIHLGLISGSLNEAIDDDDDDDDADDDDAVCYQDKL